MDIEKAKYIKTTAKKVKQAIEDLIETAMYPSPAKVSVKPYKSTKYFEIHVDIDMDIQRTVDEEDIQYAVDFYFNEDGHNQTMSSGNTFRPLTWPSRLSTHT